MSGLAVVVGATYEGLNEARCIPKRLEVGADLSEVLRDDSEIGFGGFYVARDIDECRRRA